MMDTYEFEFPGGSATVTTTGVGTPERPAFLVSGSTPLAGGTYNDYCDVIRIFAAEVLKLADKVEERTEETKDLRIRLASAVGGQRFIADNWRRKVEDLEHNLVVAGEARENTETRLLGRIAELEEEAKDLRAVLKTVFALNPEMGEAEVARLQARIESLRDRVREEMEKNASLRADLVSLRIDLAAAIKIGEEAKHYYNLISVVEDGRFAESRLLKEENRLLRDALARMDHLDALVSSEQVPGGLEKALMATPYDDQAAGAWRWFREQLGETAGQTATEPCVTAMQLAVENARLNNLLAGNFRVSVAHEACIAQHEKESARLRAENAELLRESALIAHETAKLWGDTEPDGTHWRFVAANLANRAVRALEAVRAAEAPVPVVFAVCGKHGYCQLPAGHGGEHMGPPSHQPSDDAD